MLNGTKVIKPNENLHQKLLFIGKFSGCHQLPERSFFVKDYQFPICARCTGVLLGNIIGLVGAFVYILNWRTLVLGCSIMFLDWHLQFIRLVKSTNTRRLITGIIGGYSLTSIYMIVLQFIWRLVI